MKVSQEISDKIKEMFKATLETIDRQSNCEHDFPNNFGKGFFICVNCGYVVHDPKLFQMIKQSRSERNVSLLK